MKQDRTREDVDKASLVIREKNRSSRDYAGSRGLEPDLQRTKLLEYGSWVVIGSRQRRHTSQTAHEGLNLHLSGDPER